MQKQEWLQWSEIASKVFYRPNLFRAFGGAFGFPIVCLKSAEEDIRFFAENTRVGIEVDTMQNYWTTQGPLYYLMAQLMYGKHHGFEGLYSPAGARGRKS